MTTMIKSLVMSFVAFACFTCTVSQAHVQSDSEICKKETTVDPDTQKSIDENGYKKKPKIGSRYAKWLLPEISGNPWNISYFMDVDEASPLEPGDILHLGIKKLRNNKYKIEDIGFRYNTGAGNSHEFGEYEQVGGYALRRKGNVAVLKFLMSFQPNPEATDVGEQIHFTFTFIKSIVGYSFEFESCHLTDDSSGHSRGGGGG